jgi:hypothetical protein
MILIVQYGKGPMNVLIKLWNNVHGLMGATMSSDRLVIRQFDPSVP